MAKGNMTIDKAGTTPTAGNYGFKKLGKKTSVQGLSGWTADYSYKPTVTQLRDHVQEYLDTGKFNLYGTKGASEIAKKIENDLQARGAEAYADGKYIRTVDNLKVLLSKSSKDGSWSAKISNAGERDTNAFRDALKTRKKK